MYGITGKIGSGKTTFVDYACETFGFDQYAFAQPIKEIAQVMGFEHHELYGTQQEKLQINEHWGISGREFLQKFGTEIMRDALPVAIPNMELGSESIWIKLFKIRRSRQIRDKFLTPLIVSDVRFPDEAAAIRDGHGSIIRIVRPREEKNDIHATHVSEALIDNIPADITIINDGTIDELYKKIDTIFEVAFDKVSAKSSTLHVI